jgi:hypothetical protein
MVGLRERFEIYVPLAGLDKQNALTASRSHLKLTFFPRRRDICMLVWEIVL